MELKTGAAESTLDDKGRVNIPIRFREYFQGQLFISRGTEKCAMIMTEAYCERVIQKAAEKINVYNKRVKEALKYKHLRLIDEVDVDKAGRVAIPSQIRKYANLTRNCYVIRDGERLFIWDREIFEAYLSETETLVQEAMDKQCSEDIFDVD